MSDVATELACKYCGKPAKSKSGNTNHEKGCLKNQGANGSGSTPMANQNPYDRTSRIDEERPERTDRSNGTQKPAKGSPFQFGAFLVMADYVPILLDVDFCIALGNHILEHGSPNSAIMAFAHQLNKLEGD